MKKVLFPILVLAVAMALPMAVVVGAAPANLVTNGGFEAPILPDTWECYPTGTPGLVWTVDMSSGGGPSTDGLELQKMWTPAEGNQYAELDGWEPDTIYQDLTTVTDGFYLLSFAFSPRPGAPFEDNKLEVKWGGVVVDTIQADGTGLTDTDWTDYSYVVQASGTSTELRFTDLGIQQQEAGTGTFLDDVSVILPIEQEQENFLTGGGTIQDGRKPAWNLSGNVGFLPAGTIVGNSNIVDHLNNNHYKCHNAFTALAFSGDPTTSPPTEQYNIATFTGIFTDKDGNEVELTIYIEDNGEPGKGVDWIDVSGGLTIAGQTIDGGNYQVHDGFKE